MKVVSVLLGAVAVAGVGSKPTFAKLVHLYFSNIYIYIYYETRSTCIICFRIFHFCFLTNLDLSHANLNTKIPKMIQRDEYYKLF